MYYIFYEIKITFTTLILVGYLNKSHNYGKNSSIIIKYFECLQFVTLLNKPDLAAGHSSLYSEYCFYIPQGNTRL